ncbi:MAG: hypothetical protein WC709_06380 [Thermoleophilia bacterium]
MTSIPFLLRDHRDELWQRWARALEGAVDAEYRELIAGPLGERMLRGLVNDLIACSEAEEYELPGLLRGIESRVTAEARHRLALGFKVLDLLVALHALRGAIVDVLQDALVQDEMPPFAVSLDQLKNANAFLDRLVCASLAAA